MFDSVLRVYAEEFDVDAFLALCSLTVPAEVYRKGENDILGNPNSESGFDALISDNENGVEHLNEIRSFLQSNEVLFAKLKDVDAHSIVDIGFTVGGEDQVAPSIQLPAELLGLFHRLNIAVEISTYPEVNE